MNTNPNDKPAEGATAQAATGAEGFSRPMDVPGTAAFQRPGAAGPQTPRVPGAGYSPAGFAAPMNSPYGAAPGMQSPAGSASTEARSANAARRLVVGEGITMSGEIESCDTLIVEGTVEAVLKGASILDIAETGVFYGTVEIDECTIAGRFEGDITVNGRLTLKASGSVTGSIAYKELAVESGGTLDGKLSPLSASGKKAEKRETRGAKAGKPSGAGDMFAGQAAE